MENKGFTLIELLIVIAIIGILVGIALPSYQAHIRTANRIDVQLAMTEMSLVAERQYARQNSYPTSAASTGVETVDAYDTTFESSAAVGTTPASFLITSTPKAGTSQVSDKCGVLSLTQTGESKAIFNSLVEVGGCW